MLLTAAQALAAGAVLRGLARGRERRPPLRPSRLTAPVSVVVPARDEAARIGACLAGLGEAAEVVVVDDGSTDGTADAARAAGARVVQGAALPPGWAGKAWALQQGLEAAAHDLVVCLDADVRPRPGLLGALAAQLDRDDVLVTASCRFVRQGPLERQLHAALLASLVLRFGPQDGAPPPRDRVLVNGQCLAARRGPLLAAGGLALVRGHLTEDAALGRALHARGWEVRFVDGTALADVEMYAGLAATWHGWGRSIALADVTPPARRAADVAALALTQGLPPLRALARRATPLDLALLALRAALTAGLRGAYDGPVWASPLLDPAAVARVAWSAARPSREWRGRRYDTASATASTTP